MNHNAIKRALAAVVALLFAGGVASAKFPKPGKSGTKSANVTIIQAAKLGNGPELQPGDYRATLTPGSDSTEVAFYQDGKLVAKAPAKLVDQGKKAAQTEINYDRQNNMITEMEISGLTQKVVFSGAGTGNNSGT